MRFIIRFLITWNCAIFDNIVLLFAGRTSPNGFSICNASCDCSTENCRLMLLANPELKSTGWKVCEINVLSPVAEITTTTVTQTTIEMTSGQSNFPSSRFLKNNLYVFIHINQRHCILHHLLGYFRLSLPHKPQTDISLDVFNLTDQSIVLCFQDYQYDNMSRN